MLSKICDGRPQKLLDLFRVVAFEGMGVGIGGFDLLLGHEHRDLAEGCDKFVLAQLAVAIGINFVELTDQEISKKFILLQLFIDVLDKSFAAHFSLAIIQSFKVSAKHTLCILLCLCVNMVEKLLKQSSI